MSKPKLEKIQYLQILDRINVTCSNIDNHLLQHPVCKLEKEITHKVEEALDKLFEATLEIKNSLGKKEFYV